MKFLQTNIILFIDVLLWKILFVYTIYIIFYLRKQIWYYAKQNYTKYLCMQTFCFCGSTFPLLNLKINQIKKNKNLHIFQEWLSELMLSFPNAKTGILISARIDLTFKNLETGDSSIPSLSGYLANLSDRTSQRNEPSPKCWIL